ncbi:uncharacterized protein LOC119190116 [Manduca sexta]|uniref:uncharacterized protein LOC119190116 n=1 Tax=Manduca sexta TaxID=7130 RepID=UPI00188EB640|nr:uncharacterized protein LOC119190116 [Manduca sexta]XP_037297081.1 uncharacterized protein LOC119190116 [Manduca sexta]
MDKESEKRRLETPSRSRTCRRSETGPSLSRTRSRSRNERGRAKELELERKRIKRLELELQRDRDMLREREGSARRLSNARSETCRARTKQHRGSERGHHVKRTRSRSPSYSTNDVVKIIKSIKQGLDSQPTPQNAQLTKNIDHKNILPNFDPSVTNQRIDIWLKKVNECASVYGWDDRTTIHFSLQKLQGLAKIWFESLDTIMFSWQEWQEKLTTAFPHEHNYGQYLEDMLKRKSKFNEPIETYYYEKLALLNMCDIAGKGAVDCIIHGISDRTIKSSALAVRCSQPEQLLQFLMSNRDSITLHQPSNCKNRNLLENTDATSGHSLETNEKKVSNQSVFCFNCKERGHPYLQCPRPLVKCNTCNKIGHKAENCFSKAGNVKTPDS